MNASRRAARAARGLALPAFFFTLSSPTHAHLLQTGLGPFYDGIGHFFLTPEGLLAVLVLALLSGLRSAAHGRAALAALVMSWAVGGAVGLVPAVAASGVPESIGRFAGVPLVVLGVLAAIDWALTVRAVAGLGILVGIPPGLDSGAAMAQTALGWRGLAGTLLALAVFATLAIGFVATIAPRLLARRVARVAASWVAASGLLLLGWSLR